MNTLVILLVAVVVTVAVETGILALAGYRTRVFITACVLVNIATNLTLNLALSFVDWWAYWSVLYPAEIAIVLIEWAVLRLVADKGQAVRLFSKPSLRLLLFVFLANLATFLLGFLLFP